MEQANTTILLWVNLIHFVLRMFQRPDIDCPWVMPTNITMAIGKPEATTLRGRLRNRVIQSEVKSSASAGSCENGVEPSSYIQDEEVLDYRHAVFHPSKNKTNIFMNLRYFTTFSALKLHLQHEFEWRHVVKISSYKTRRRDASFNVTLFLSNLIEIRLMAVTRARKPRPPMTVVRFAYIFIILCYFLP